MGERKEMPETHFEPVDRRAMLMAAAPELYEALEALLKYTILWDDPPSSLTERARAALAKARGEE